MDLNEGCTIKHIDFEINSRVTLSNVSNEVILMPQTPVLDFKIINTTDFELPNIEYSRFNQSKFVADQQRIEEIKKNLQFNEFDYHDCHHYGMIYIIIMILVIIFIFAIRKMNGIRKLNKIVNELKTVSAPISAPKVQRAISMPHIPEQ